MTDPVDLTEPPSLLREFARATLTAPLRRGTPSALPGTVLRLPNATIDRERLVAYQHLTGFALSDRVPATYPHVLGFPLQAQLMAAPDFPLALPGLIHITNEITQHDPLSIEDTPDVTVHAERLRPHPRGRAVDLVTELHRGDTLVWSSRSTYLQRGAEAADAVLDEAPPPVPAALPSARWRVPADLGRRYAAVSGDVNPIHLHPWAARLFGFPRAIAHGMWSLARVLAAYGPATQRPHTNRVWFRKPILLPSTVALVRDAQLAAVVDAKSQGQTHLVVRVS